ncbi:MAG: hypothetical protein IJ756_06525 [Paludibacteraceae bacterium]|nr:hypothetical protein [Paludibacteraceae bacterium]
MWSSKQKLFSQKVRETFDSSLNSWGCMKYYVGDNTDYYYWHFFKNHYESDKENIYWTYMADIYEPSLFEKITKLGYNFNDSVIYQLAEFLIKTKDNNTIVIFGTSENNDWRTRNDNQFCRLRGKLCANDIKNCDWSQDIIIKENNVIFIEIASSTKHSKEIASYFESIGCQFLYISLLKQKSESDENK